MSKAKEDPKPQAPEAAPNTITLYLKKPWRRTVPGVKVGDVVATVTLPAAGVDLNLVVDSLRRGVVGEAQPKAE